MNQPNYKPLDPDRKEIRLIEILSPGTETSPAECCLSTVSLVGNPSFAALSYVWGDSLITENIILDGCAVPVTINLAEALRNVKQHWQQQNPGRDRNSFRLWVDAVCINQKDIRERNQQVQLMRSIYSQAEMVLSWLGPGYEGMCLALRTFHIIAMEVKGTEDDDLSLQWMEKYPSLCVQDEDRSEDGLGNKAWTAMWNFFELPYWYRAWIFQELVLASNVLFVYCSESLRYEDLEAVCVWSRRVQYEGPRQLYQLPRPISMSNSAWKAATDPYLDWYVINKVALAKKKLHEPARRWNFLLICRNLRATDPKDHIYGLLGILEEGLEAKITPDYEKTVGEVYCEAICLWVEEEQDLLFLYLAGIGRFEYDLSAPSWTPNFTKASENTTSWYITTGHADWSAFENNIDRISVSQSTLQAIGLAVDIITRIEETPKLDTWEDGRMLQYCIDFASRTPVYVTGVPPLQAIVHVLMMYEASEEDHQYLCLLALGFLRYVLFSTELDCDPQDRLKLLGLSTGDRFPESFEEKVSPGCDFLNSGLPNLSTELASTEGPLVDATRNVMQTVIRYKDAFRFIETPSGYLGLAPNGVAIGDIICVLKGCGIPVVLRKVNDHYVHVGTCFVLGLMEGEAAELLETGRAKVQRFEIQ